MRTMNLIALSIALIFIGTSNGFSDSLLIELPNGDIRGRDQGNYYSYESIPYAEPPINSLRLEDPQPFTKRWTETFDATQPANECLQWSQFIRQPNKLTGSEDCLTVSVYIPKNSTRTAFPVVASIFNGGWSFGNTIDDGVDPLMDSGNVIVVKINYRLGALGFISTGDAVLPGNLGLKDQRLGIQWIKENIARFGGDPANIILLGFATAGSAVHLHLLNKDMENFVKGGISIDGTATNPWALQTNARPLAFKLGKILGCDSHSTSTELKNCLKKADAGAFVSALQKFQIFGYVPFAPFRPVVEPSDSANPIITKHPVDILKSGDFAQVPWLTSYTPESGIYNAALLLSKNSNGKERITELNRRWNQLAPHFFSFPSTMTAEMADTHAQELKRRYLGAKNFSVANYFEVQRMFTNEMFKHGIELSIDLQSRHGKSPVYAYVYDNPGDGSLAQLLAKRSDIFLGTGPGDDYNLLMSNPIAAPPRADEKIISWKLIKMVEEFVENGSLVYDNCKFPDNLGRELFHLVVIRRNKCEVVHANHLPDTVSNNLPAYPIITY